MKSDAIFHFSGSDSWVQFHFWFLIHGAGMAPLPIFIWQLAGMTAAIAYVSIVLLVIAGSRASITVSASGVVITKGWLFLPLWRYSGPVIEDFWCSEENLEGVFVVVKLQGKEIEIGSRKSVNHLCKSLAPLRVKEASANAETH